MELFKNTNFDFLGKKWPFIIASLVLTVADADAFRPAPNVEVVTPFEDTHWGTREMTVRDPDGRIWRLQAPRKG